MKIYSKKPKSWPNFLRKIYKKSLIKSFPLYQPVWQNGKLASSDRDCSDRWQLIEKELGKEKIETLIDLGSAEGFYVLNSAKNFGIFSLGVDADERRISVAQMQLTDEKIENAGFVFSTINEKFIKKMPVFNVVIFMSVAHHMIREIGEEKTREIISLIKQKTNKFMIFEMGQPNEIENKWVKDLPEMKPNPEEWIKKFLMSCGFSEVIKIGESQGYGKKAKRSLFKAIP